MEIDYVEVVSLLQRAIDYDEELTKEEWQLLYQCFTEIIPLEYAPPLQKLKKLIDELDEGGDTD